MQKTKLEREHRKLVQLQNEKACLIQQRLRQVLAKNDLVRMGREKIILKNLYSTAQFTMQRPELKQQIFDKAIPKMALTFAVCVTPSEASGNQWQAAWPSIVDLVAGYLGSGGGALNSDLAFSLFLGRMLHVSCSFMWKNMTSEHASLAVGTVQASKKLVKAVLEASILEPQFKETMI